MTGCTADNIGVCKESTMHQNSLFCSDACLGQHLEKVGQTSYHYYFQRKLPGDNAGAFHGAELWYMFGTLKRCWRPMTEGDYKLSEQMLDAWTNFMKCGNPGWPPFKDNGYVKVFDIEK